MQREKDNHITFLNSVFILWDIVEMSTKLTIVVVCYAKHINGGCGRNAPRPHYYEAFQSNTLTFSSIGLTCKDIITMLVKSDFLLFAILCLAHIGTSSEEVSAIKSDMCTQLVTLQKRTHSWLWRIKSANNYLDFIPLKPSWQIDLPVRKSKTVAKRSLYCQLN